MQISKGWLARIAEKVRALFTSNVVAVDVAVKVPSLAAMPLMDAPPARPALPRMLSARIACQAKLNVPVGKKPRIAPIVSAKTATRRPKAAVEAKKPVNVRSAYLPARHLARHLAAKTQPKSRSNVIQLSVAAKVTKSQAKGPNTKALRIAA
jgi:hypothetical protein